MVCPAYHAVAAYFTGLGGWSSFASCTKVASKSIFLICKDASTA